MAFCGLARMGDLSSGHYPMPIMGASGYSVMVNGRPTACVGDYHNTHMYSEPEDTHPYFISTGNFSVFIQGRPAAIVGSIESCGARIQTGSFSVFG